MHSIVIYDTRTSGFTYRSPFATDDEPLELCVEALTVVMEDGAALPNTELRLMADGDYPVKVVDGGQSNGITLAGCFNAGGSGSVLMRPAYAITTHAIDDVGALNKLQWSLCDDRNKPIDVVYMLVHVSAHLLDEDTTSDHASEDSEILEEFLEGATFRKHKPFDGAPLKRTVDGRQFWGGVSSPIAPKIATTTLDEFDDAIRFDHVRWNLVDVELGKFSKLMKKWREHECMGHVSNITVTCKAELRPALSKLKWPGEPAINIVDG
jgi:hypothetical protein